MPAARSKKSPSTAEVSAMEKPSRAAKPGVEGKRTARKTPAAAAKPRTRTARPESTKPETPPPAELSAAATTARRRPRLLLAVTSLVLLVVSAAVALAVFLLVRDDPAQQIRPGVAAVLSPDELASFARLREAPVYWAGDVPGRELEVTTTRTGTFVRYLPPNTPAGDSRRALTIATYPLSNAYATATRRAAGPQMAKRSLPAGGIAVWSQAQPTSIYLAFQGVPQLVEIYAPTQAEARRFALSGRVRPVS